MHYQLDLCQTLKIKKNVEFTYKLGLTTCVFDREIALEYISLRVTVSLIQAVLYYISTNYLIKPAFLTPEIRPLVC